MGVSFDLDDVYRALDAAPKEVGRVLSRMGQEAVGYAKEHGSYRDRTGTLRAGNRFESDEQTLTVENDTPYASNVEHRGYEVLTCAKYDLQNRYDLKEQ